MAGTEYTLPRATFTDPVKLLIVVAPFYRDIADMMIAGAVAGRKGASRSAATRSASQLV